MEDISKTRNSVQYECGSEFQPVGVLYYIGDLKRGFNVEIGAKYFFIASIVISEFRLE